MFLLMRVVCVQVKTEVALAKVAKKRAAMIASKVNADKKEKMQLDHNQVHSYKPLNEHVLSKAPSCVNLYLLA